MVSSRVTRKGSSAKSPTAKSPTHIDRHVSARVRMQRNVVGISQTELGQLAGGVTFQQIQKYENGVNRIGASRLHLISKALGVPVEFFLRALRSPPAPGAARSSPRPFRTSQASCLV